MDVRWFGRWLGRAVAGALIGMAAVAPDARPAAAQGAPGAPGVPGERVRDCPGCPEMVAIPAGRFIMGTSAREQREVHRAMDAREEGPQHPVAVERFLIGVYPVTFDEWEACVAAGGCTHRPSDMGWGRGRRPVINVSFDDAQEYVRWLTRATGRTYRLPSEAEWEYAARAGTTTARWWGNAIGRGNANCDGCGSRWDARMTAPVGSFRANAWGMHDVQGNVWQWTEDCQNFGYDGAPADGRPWRTGDCSWRSNRGGELGSGPYIVRSGARGWARTHIRYQGIGFRIAAEAARPGS